MNADDSRPCARLDLDYYLLFDAQTQRILFTRTGKTALAARFARAGVDINAIRTFEALEQAIATVVWHEFKRLTPAQQDDDACTDPINDLYFITDRIEGRPALPLVERRRRLARGNRKLFTLLGLPVEPA